MPPPQQYDDPIDDGNTRREFPEMPIDRYRIVQHIGKGAFSRVFLAYTPEFQRRAVKRIRMTAKPHMLLKEIEFLRRLEGKDNIVQIKEIRFHEANLQTTVITNYLDSDDFKAIILEFTPREIQAYMRSLLTALSHLEKAPDPNNSDLRGILHRDVKPGNFLFERSTGKGLLIDFGLAQSIKEAREFPLMRQIRRQHGHSSSSAPQVQPTVFQRAYEIAGYINKEVSTGRNLPTQPHSGTHGYRAPEILVPVRNQDTKIDAWSAGVILLQIITGKTSIFRGNPNTDVYELLAIRSIIGTDRFIQGMSRLRADFSLTAGVAMPQNVSLEELCEWYNPDLLAVLPASCFDLCRKLLDFDPESRLSASEALKHQFLATPPELLPDFRYQDGACNKSVVSFMRDFQSGQAQSQQRRETDEAHLAALRKRSTDIAELLGLCKGTADTLSDEYSRMILSQMIPLPKEIKKQIEKAVQKYGADRSVQSPCGLIIERPNPADYQFPANQAVQNLSQAQPTVLAKPRMASAPGWQARPQYSEQKAREAIKIELEKFQASDEFQKLSADEQKRQMNRITKQTRRKVYDELWEAANVEKESFERAVRATAFRRRVDPWIQPLKALDKELRLAQRQVRLAAEEYRALVIEKGLVQAPTTTTDTASHHKKGVSDSKTGSDTVASPGKQSDNVQQKRLVTNADGTVNIERKPGTTQTQPLSQHRLISFLLNQQIENGTYAQQSAAMAIASRAWAMAERRALQQHSTDPTVQKLNELNKKAAKLATVSHRIALNGPAGWNVQGWVYYDRNQTPNHYAAWNYCQDVASRAYQLQRTIQMSYNQLQQYNEQYEQLLVFIEQNQADLSRFKQELKNLQAQEAGNKKLIEGRGEVVQGICCRREVEGIEFNVRQTQELLGAYEKQKQHLEEEMRKIRDQIKQIQAEKAEQITQYLKGDQEVKFGTAPGTQGGGFEIGALENTSNLWSETVTVSDEFSEIRPPEENLRAAGVDYDPAMLQEPFFTNQDEIKRAFQEQDALTMQRKDRRLRLRKFEAVKAKFYDPSLQQLNELQKEIVSERQKLIEKLNQQEQSKENGANGPKGEQEVKRKHNDVVPRDIQRIGPSILSQVVALQQLGSNVYGRKVESYFEARSRFSQQKGKDEQTTQNPTIPDIQSRLDTQRKATALFNLFASPLGRFYMVFHRLIGGNPTELTERGSIVQILRKAELPISSEFVELQTTLQKLSTNYLQSGVGKKDLLLVAAAVQSELDLKSDNAQNPELANMGLSRRAPNLEYLLQVHGKLSPLIRPMEDGNTRSTSAITGLTKSATHRSLADPSRTQSRYPQTAKYIQTMLEQTMKRYVTLPGVVEEMEREMRESIIAIKARMFDVCVEELYRSSARNTQARLWLGRIRDAVRELGAQTVYEVARAVAFPEAYACVANPEAGTGHKDGAGEAGTGEKLVYERWTMNAKQPDVSLGAAVTNAFGVRRAELAVRASLEQGPVAGGAGILEKTAFQARTRQLLLDDRYGGRRHRKMVQWH